MLRARTGALALLAMLAALAFGACGGDDEDDSGGSAETQETKAQGTTTDTETTDTGASTGAAADNPRAEALTSCLEREGFNVIVNPGSQVDADYQLVIDAGSGGVLYGYADEAAASSAKGKVENEEGSAGRDVEVLGDAVFAFFPAGQTLAEPEKYEKVRACASG
jgi:ABC-type glycerol-3-phosphate transport system substrate-binding protein